MNRLHTKCWCGVLSVVACVLTTQPAYAIEASPLHTVFTHFHTHGRELSAFQTVNELALRLGLSCFYLAPENPTGGDAMIELDLSNVTPAQVLDQIVAQDTQLTWVPVTDRIVNILPTVLLEDHTSVLYRPISNFELEDATLGDALAAIQRLLPEADRYGAGIGGSSGYNIFQREVSLSLKSGTYLDLINALLKAAGDDVSLLANGTTSMVPLKVFHARCETTSLARAEKYLQKGPLADRDEAMALFNAALEDAPYDALRKVIRFQIAELQMGSAGRLAGVLTNAAPHRPEALAAFLDLAAPKSESDSDAGVHFMSRDFAVNMLMEDGKPNEARQLLTSLLNDEFASQRIDLEATYGSLIGIDLHGVRREEALRLLLPMRDEYPENEDFHRALESRIARESASSR